MTQRTVEWLEKAILLLVVVAASAVLLAQNQPSDNAPPQPGEGCLLYRSPISGRYDAVPLLHTDVKLDVQGLVESATVTQQYANSSNAPIEAGYNHCVPALMAVRAMDTGRRQVYDPQKREIRDG